jgi:hypothetical protein
MDRHEHWQEVYGGKPPSQLGWYRPRLETSLEWILALGLEHDTPLLDVGCGASTLVDDLLEAGFTAITALDIAENALDAVRGRLGDSANAVEWIATDITDAELPRDRFRLWHDRAVFHFLTEPADRGRYREQMEAALEDNGYLLMGVFTPDAPPRCSGLPVQRYALDDLVAELGKGFDLIRHQHELHVTPGGVEQAYLYALFEKTG